jgi:hypothetical protein
MPGHSRSKTGVLSHLLLGNKAWVAGTSPAMTPLRQFILKFLNFKTLLAC